MASNEEGRCGSCNKAEDEENKFKRCSACRVAAYCSVECQKTAWGSHKADCTESCCLQLLAAIDQNDRDTVERLAKIKRVLNGKVDYTPVHGDERPYTLKKWTALHQCVRSGNIEMMKVLIENGAKVEIKDADGETPAFIASSNSNPEAIKILLAAGANPNFQARDGFSCLMMAVRDGKYEQTKALLEAGANLYVGSDMFGRGALDIAAQQSTGQGIRMSQGEPYEEARERYRQVYSLLTEYSNRR